MSDALLREIEMQKGRSEDLSRKLNAERALADDLIDVLACMVVGWEDRLGVDLAQHPEVLRVSARYREARGR